MVAALARDLLDWGLIDVVPSFYKLYQATPTLIPFSPVEDTRQVNQGAISAFTHTRHPRNTPNPSSEAWTGEERPRSSCTIHHVAGGKTLDNSHPSMMSSETITRSGTRREWNKARRKR